MQRGSWWQTGIIYQIYPRSFQDTNGDGIGDLRGITQRLPYLKELGVDAIWLSPIFPSPMADFGYDISDYTGIDPLFGNLDDFDALLAAAHSQGLKVILDLVSNHTSDRHPWFLESRASRHGRKRDWYIWRDPAANGGPPNNWLSVFWCSSRARPDGQQEEYALGKALWSPKRSVRTTMITGRDDDYWAMRQGQPGD
jgi:alpha-glucosidase